MGHCRHRALIQRGILHNLLEDSRAEASKCSFPYVHYLGIFVWCDLPGEGIVLRKTVVGDYCFNYLSGRSSESSDFHLTLKMTTTQVVKTSVTNNSLSKDYPHPDDHAKQITDTPGFKPFTIPWYS